MRADEILLIRARRDGDQPLHLGVFVEELIDLFAVLVRHVLDLGACSDGLVGIAERFRMQSVIERWSKLRYCLRQLLRELVQLRHCLNFRHQRHESLHAFTQPLVLAQE